ncbi:MAG: stage II sporulation protein M [Actinomycetota bacterium]|nr:stage II sporulation protein M [Actinomycetota bacterium]
MDVDQFLLTNQPTWARLDQLMGRAGRGVGRLSPDELDELVRLYQRVSSHLSYARTYYHDPALSATLTRRVARANALVYGTRPRTLRAVARFFTVTFPAAVWHSRRFVAASAVLLFVPALALGIWIANSNEAVNASAPAEVRQAMINHQFEDYYSSEPAAAFASKVFTNNVRVAILAFAFGVAFCIPTALVLIYNGAGIGVVAGLFAAVGQPGKFWGLVLPHGLLELTAVCIAGAAGLRLGWTLIDPGDRRRSTALAEEGRRAVVIVVGLIAAFAVAGIIEGFVTGSSLPTWLRVGIGATVELAFVVYVISYGRAAAAQGLTGTLGEEPQAEADHSRPVALTLR